MCIFADCFRPFEALLQSVSHAECSHFSLFFLILPYSFSVLTLRPVVLRLSVRFTDCVAS